MAEDIEGLIAKIQQEGIKKAEDKAKDIENKARGKAEAIVAEAEKEAKKLIAATKDELAKMQEKGRASLEQAGRDLLLSLREEISAILDKLIASETRKALGPEELSKIITALIKERSGRQQGDIVVSLKEKDFEKLKKGFLGKLADETKKGIILKASGEISGGFIISYDGGKSHYDFTDTGIAEYLSMYLKPKLAEALKKVASSGRKK